MMTEFLFTPLEWSIFILSYISFFYLMERRASNPKIRLRGILINLIAGGLQIALFVSIGLWSMALLSFTFIFLKLFGMINCIKEIRNV